jgi:hypothetical protein
VPANAAWCSLCFADLRAPVAAPVREPAVVAATASLPLATVDQVAADSATPAAHPHVPTHAAQPAGAAPVEEPDPLAALEAAAVQAANPAAPSPTWPCPQCGAKVAMDMDFCNECGAGFLSGVADGASVRLPVVGEVKTMSSSQRLMMGVMVAVALMAVIVALAFIGGHLFN